MAIPDLTQKVIGFRQWNIEEDMLYPISTGRDAWQPGPQQAICQKYRPHEGVRILDPCIPAVNPFCDCGFYSLHRLTDAHWGGDNIRGIVLGWGRMAIHDEGWRAQFVEVAALIYPKGSTVAEKDQVDRIARNYHVPTVEWGRAEDYAKEFGDYVPESLKPKSWDEHTLDLYESARANWMATRAEADRNFNVAQQHGLREEAVTHFKVNRMVEEAMEILDPTVPEAYAALHNIYVANVGELLQGLNEGIVVDYIPKPEKPQAAEIKVDRHFEISISTNATVLWLPLQAPVRHK